ncbi:MAG: acyltransferase [Rhodobacteraceae bacterium]|nr:MAG: acyltransferase [Paracoccaceae bacterium]
MRADPGMRPRVDIQVLRAVAVAMVVLFHARVPGLAGGYLGVDIFLVISGYLIVGMIARGIAEGTFTLGGFFLDRAKRLLPAAYTVYVATGIAALWLLTETEMQRYLETLLGALTFTANIVLWQGTDYFASEAKLNVLLHVWSLSLEEQFYLILPFILVLTPRRFWPVLILGGLLLSLALCLVAVPRSPVASFYLLPTRAWELLIGGALALSEPRIGAALRAGLARLGWVAFAVILSVPVVLPGERLGLGHPGLDALLVTLATAVLIAGRPGFLNRSDPVTRAAYWLGGISYALYLVHWPLFAFAQNAHLGQVPPLALRLGLIAVSIGLAAALFAGVEKPIHRMQLAGRRGRGALAALGATGFVALAGVGLAGLRDVPRDYAALSAPNRGLSAACDFAGDMQPLAACRTGETPRTLIWGDSFAMHLSGALPQSVHPLVQATKSNCAPALGVAQIGPEIWQDAAWARACIGFNDSVVAYVADHPEIETVIVSSLFGQILGATDQGVLRVGNDLQRAALTGNEGATRFLETLRALVGFGREVIVVGPTPSIGIDMATCLERREMGLITLGPHSDCKLGRDAARAFRAEALALLDRAAAVPGVAVIDLIEVLCPTDACLLQTDGTLLFRDAGHLSIAGARLLGQGDRLGLGQMLASRDD